MRYSDEELDKADEYLGMNTDEQESIHGNTQVHIIKEVKESANEQV